MDAKIVYCAGTFCFELVEL